MNQKEHWDDADCLSSAQFQVGSELSEATTLENRDLGIGGVASPNTGNAFLEQWLRAIGAVNGN